MFYLVFVTKRQGGAFLTHAFGVNPLIQDCKIWLQETRNNPPSGDIKYMSIS